MCSVVVCPEAAAEAEVVAADAAGAAAADEAGAAAADEAGAAADEAGADEAAGVDEQARSATVNTATIAIIKNFFILCPPLIN